jgi:hypothetical protein
MLRNSLFRSFRPLLFLDANGLLKATPSKAKTRAREAWLYCFPCVDCKQRDSGSRWPVNWAASHLVRSMQQAKRIEAPLKPLEKRNGRKISSISAV